MLLTMTRAAPHYIIPEEGRLLRREGSRPHVAGLRLFRG
jgi:hypothetical protein